MNDSILLYERYLLDVKHSAANTVASYIRDIKQYTSYVDDMLQCPLELVTPDQAAVYFAWLTNNGKSSSTVTRSLASIKGAHFTAKLA